MKFQNGGEDENGGGWYLFLDTLIDMFSLKTNNADRGPKVIHLNFVYQSMRIFTNGKEIAIIAFNLLNNCPI